MLFGRSRAADEPLKIEGGRFQIPGWDPDDPKHDAQFPDHPVARLRRVIDHVAGSLAVAAEVRGCRDSRSPRPNKSLNLTGAALRFRAAFSRCSGPGKLALALG